ncbi:MICOS complex subunit Mic10-like [Bacillus rossius redtenbacheri]|uniref:MICOS complex subunit Mic10-like n=1 Tax=Bacillus rossius redtenbacheri TaxID=93214 RepID=UPI002FDED289
MSTSAKLLSEDELGRKWDSCLHDTVLKLGGGLVVGGIFSLLFFRRKAWPIAMGSGFGLGMAYLNCERAVNGIITQSTIEKGH